MTIVVGSRRLSNWFGTERTTRRSWCGVTCGPGAHCLWFSPRSVLATTNHG